MTQTPPSQEQPTGSKLASMECACPVCGKTVLTISGQTFMYVNDHVLHPGPGGEGTTTLVLGHPGTPTAIHPSEGNDPPWALSRISIFDNNRALYAF